jgi:6-phosphogluconolactonase
MTMTSMARSHRLHLSLAAVLTSAFVSATGPAGATGTSTAGPDHSRPLVVGGFGSPAIAVLGTSRDGALSAVPGSPYASSLLSLALAITPDARHVYSASTATGTITGHRLAADGTVTPLTAGTVHTGLSVSGLAITPDGSRLFATVGGAVRSWTISPSGVLIPTGASPAQTGALSLISQVAITPDGRHVIVSNYLSDSISVFAIGPDSALTRVGAPVPTGSRPVMPVFTPDGRFLYVSNESGASLSGYAVGADGRLTPTPGSPYRTPSTPHGAAITPDGTRLYVPSSGVDVTGDNSVVGFRVNADGSLIDQLPGSPYSVQGAVGRVVLSPDARNLYTVEGVGDVIGAPAPPALPPTLSPLSLGELDPDGDPLLSEVHSYVVAPDGRISPSGHPPVSTGLLWSDGSTAFTAPNQGPVAAGAVTRRTGLEVTLSAAGSYDLDGDIATYAWDFGDGTRLTTTTPTVTHRYVSAAQPATASVTVTDDEGCSATFVYTGTTATCTGGPAAKSSVAVNLR